jgi:hypothetical protein
MRGNLERNGDWVKGRVSPNLLISPHFPTLFPQSLVTLFLGMRGDMGGLRLDNKNSIFASQDMIIDNQ